MLLGIDYGKKRIGLALGAVIPKGAGVLDAGAGLKKIFAKISEICRENEVEKIIVGMPYRGEEEGTLSTEIRKFAKGLEKETGLSIVFEPEQYTSTEAERLLSENGARFSRKGGEIDELAAILILEQYINRISQQ